MAQCKTLFAQEEGLVASFFAYLTGGKTPWSSCGVAREFDYSSGRTDVLSLSETNEILAFEAKLSNWRKALHQAWRNTSFANRAYVVLPRNRSASALSHRREFEALGVGLCLVDHDGVEVAIESEHKEPVILWLHNKARGMLAKNGRGSDRNVGTYDMPTEPLRLRPVVRRRRV